MTKEEFKSKIEDIIDDNRIYGWDTVTALIMEEIDKPPFHDNFGASVSNKVKKLKQEI